VTAAPGITNLSWRRVCREKDVASEFVAEGELAIRVLFTVERKNLTGTIHENPVNIIKPIGILNCSRRLSHVNTPCQRLCDQWLPSKKSFKKYSYIALYYELHLQLSLQRRLWSIRNFHYPVQKLVIKIQQDAIK
jgi:hypothetical protein